MKFSHLCIFYEVLYSGIWKTLVILCNPLAEYTWHTSWGDPIAEINNRITGERRLPLRRRNNRLQREDKIKTGGLEYSKDF
jgi:hypothetical protein